MSLLLAFDLSTPRGSVGLGASGRILGERELVSEKQQVVELLPAIESLLSEAGVAPRDLQGIVVGRGPGSFTGVRIAAATARGMAAALDIPLWAPSSLAAGAATWQDSTSAEPRYILFDARGDRVYAACYRREISEGAGGGESTVQSSDAGAGAGEVRPIRFGSVIEPTASTLREVMESGVPTGARFGGDGAHRHAEAIRGMGYEILPPPWGTPSAAGLLQLVLSGDVPREKEGSRWEPDYIRGSSAVPLSDR